MEKQVCRECGSDDVHIQVTAMVPVNLDFDNDPKYNKGVPWTSLDWTWDDYFWCNVCEDDTKVMDEAQYKAWHNKA